MRSALYILKDIREYGVQANARPRCPEIIRDDPRPAPTERRGASEEAHPSEEVLVRADEEGEARHGDGELLAGGRLERAGHKIIDPSKEMLEPRPLRLWHINTPSHHSPCPMRPEWRCLSSRLW